MCCRVGGARLEKCSGMVWRKVGICAVLVRESEYGVVLVFLRELIYCLTSPHELYLLLCLKWCGSALQDVPIYDYREEVQVCNVGLFPCRHPCKRDEEV